MSKARRPWTPKEKLQAVLPVIRSEVSLSEQARRLKVSEGLLYRWRDQANQALLEAFSSTGPSGHERELEDRVADLERLCGKQAVMIDVLKKRACCDHNGSGVAVALRSKCGHAGGVLCTGGDQPHYAVAQAPPKTPNRAGDGIPSCQECADTCRLGGRCPEVLCGLQ